MKKRQPLIHVTGPEHHIHISTDDVDQVKLLGSLLAKKGAAIATSPDTGVSLWVSMGAHEGNGYVVGFSPASSEVEHVEVYRLPTEYIDTMLYTGFGFGGRDLFAGRSADASIIILGKDDARYGFDMALGQHQPVGVLHGDTPTHRKLLEQIKQNAGPHRSVSATSPEELLEKLYILLDK